MHQVVLYLEQVRKQYNCSANSWNTVKSFYIRFFKHYYYERYWQNSSSYDKDTIIANISNLAYPGGNTFTAGGLRALREQIFIRGTYMPIYSLVDCVIYWRSCHLLE